MPVSASTIVQAYLKRKADLMPPLGYPGGPCHVINRIEEEVFNPSQKEELIDMVEGGHALQNAEAAKVYDLETERGVEGSRIKKMLISAHAQYRMDLRGVSVPEIRLALKDFLKRWSDEKSKKSAQAMAWEEAMAWGEKIVWEDPKIKLVVVFTLTSDTANIVTTYWPGVSDPRPVKEESCALPKKRAKIDSNPNIKVLVSPKSERNLPNGIDREKEQVLPLPGAATPGGAGRDIPKFEFNTPGDSGINDRPRTLGTPGGEVETKFDYGMPTRRTMTSARLLPLDSARLEKFLDNMFQDLSRIAKKKGPETKVGVNKNAIWEGALWVKDVLGEEKLIHVALISKLGTIGFVLGGGFGKINRGEFKGDPIIVINLNGRYPWEAIANPKVTRQDIREVLYHEATHAADVYKVTYNAKPGHLPSQDELDLNAYYNDPSEVKAFMRELYLGIEEQVTAIMDSPLAKEWGLSQSIVKMLKHNKQWQDMLPYLTSDNKNRILKGLVTSFEDKGLVHPGVRLAGAACSAEVHSWAWIDPKGGLHVLSDTETHNRWAWTHYHNEIFDLFLSANSQRWEDKGFYDGNTFYPLSRAKQKAFITEIRNNLDKDLSQNTPAPASVKTEEDLKAWKAMAGYVSYAVWEYPIDYMLNQGWMRASNFKNASINGHGNQAQWDTFFYNGLLCSGVKNPIDQKLFILGAYHRWEDAVAKLCSRQGQEKIYTYLLSL